MYICRKDGVKAEAMFDANEGSRSCAGDQGIGVQGEEHDGHVCDNGPGLE